MDLHGYVIGHDEDSLAALLAQQGTNALPMLEGAFALSWQDGADTYLARDKVGAMPLHYAPASLLADFNHAQTIREVEGGPISLLPAGHWMRVREGEPETPQRYYEAPIRLHDDDRPTAAARVRELLSDAVRDRISRDGPIAVCLSGGIDSSAIAAVLAREVEVVAYTAVFDPKSVDLRAARQVAEHLGIQLVEVPVKAPTLDDITHTIRVVELPYKAQVEIGWACLALGQVMKDDGIRYVFSGEGSDEMWASHAFAYQERLRPNAKPFSEYRRTDFAKQAARNFLREHKAFAAFGLDPRLPFLDTALLEYVLGISEPVARDNTWTAKVPLVLAFTDLLPERPLTKQKLGFQDGLGIKPAFAAVTPAGVKPGVFYRSIYREEIAPCAVS